MVQGKSALLISTGSGKNLGDRAMLRNIAEIVGENGFTEINVPFQYLKTAPNAHLLQGYTPFYSCQGRIKHRLGIGGAIGQILDVGFSAMLTLCLALLSRCRALPLTWSFGEASLIRAISRSDIVIFTGGGYLTDKGKLEARSCLWMGILANLLGKPIHMSGQGIGPIYTTLTRKLLASVANNALSIMVRDPHVSKQALLEYGVTQSHIVCVADDALSLPAIPLKAQPDVQPEYSLALHFRISPFLPDSQSLETLMATIIDSFISRGWKVKLFIFSEQAEWEADVYARITKNLDNRSYEIIDEPDPRKIKHEIGACTLAIGLAYHFYVFALSEAVPAIGLYNGEYYEQKIEGLFRLFESENDIRNYTTVNAAELEQTLMTRFEDRKTISDKLQKISIRLQESHLNHYRTSILQIGSNS